jgi:Glycosyl transferase family 2
LPIVVACLIVRDGVDSLPRLLASTRPFVDGIAVYDTGSVDGTLELLSRASREPGAPLIVAHGEWRDDFSWAREQSFALAPSGTDWIIWLDADDELMGGADLRRLLAEIGTSADGAFVYYDYARDASGQTTSASWRLRLVRRDADFRWRGVVHEDLIPPAGAEDRLVTLRPDEITVVHHRTAMGDPRRNAALLRAELRRQEDGGDVAPRVLFDLGREYAFWGAFEEAEPILRRFLDSPGAAQHDLPPHAAHLLAGCLRSTGRLNDAIAVELEAEEAWPGRTETALGLAESHAAGGSWDEAELWARHAIARGMPRTSLPHDPARLRTAPRLLLARALLARGMTDEAMAAFASAIPTEDRAGSWSAARGELSAALDAGDAERAAAIVETELARYDEARAATVRRLAAGRDQSVGFKRRLRSL